MPVLLTPHGDKLHALLNNEKLPFKDKTKILEAISRYNEWLEKLKLVDGNYKEIVSSMVGILNEYKQFIELDVIFDSHENFLYRQKGQLKLDNTIIEEFLPILLSNALSNLIKDSNVSLGPTTCFSGLRFESSPIKEETGGGMKVRTKDHDFTISRRIFIRTSHQEDFQSSLTKETNIAYIAAECKTNLDKTMFQEAAATALDVKLSVPGAKYFLFCEWLDMLPISTNTTAIDEILILRKAKRLSADIRQSFSTVEGRKENRDIYAEHLQTNPISIEILLRFLEHVSSIFKEDPESEVLMKGFF